MIDLIRKSAVSATVMQAAARGALLIPADEMVEILFIDREPRVPGLLDRPGHIGRLDRGLQGDDIDLLEPHEDEAPPELVEH